MQADTEAPTPRIRSHPSRNGVQVVDPIEDSQYTFITPEPVDPVESDTGRFHVPIDAAAAVETASLETQEFVSAWIRDRSGEMIAAVTERGSASVGDGSYTIELSTSQMKLYLAVEGALTVEFMADRTRISCPEPTTIHVGARSYHERPAATVTTTDDPEDVMAALSTFGSALKTTTCERSYPTLRGHPPLVERGDSLSIPDGIDLPETGLAIEVPPTLDAIYPVVPLAYYLGATIERGSTPRLVADDWEYSLDRDDGLGLAATRVLRQVLLLDCVTRTEGYYEVDLHERSLVEAETTLDFESLYDRPIADQVRRYLDVPRSALKSALPTWKLTADVRPRSEHVGALPFLANELALVRCPSTAGVDFGALSDAGERADSMFLDERARTNATEQSAIADETVFIPAATDSIEQVYVGEGIPFGASKMTVDAYHRRLDYELSEDPEIRVLVVCNDERMADENVVSDLYGRREWVDFDVAFETGLSVTEMRDVLQEGADFLHFIGHVDEAGIRCADGHLDTRTLSEVNVDAFMLNACNSYAQGYGLVENGAVAGIATITEIAHEAATTVGKTIAQLLNAGFSLGSTLQVLERHENFDHQYAVIGDGSRSVVGSESGTPYHVEIDDMGDDIAAVTLFGYPQLPCPMGSLVWFDEFEKHHVNSGTLSECTLPRSNLVAFLQQEESPVITDDGLVWSRDFLERL